jgi:hypothetical protein
MTATNIPVHPSHYLDVPEELDKLHQQIGRLKTENSTLKSELDELRHNAAEIWDKGFEEGERYGSTHSYVKLPANPYRN